MRPEFHEDTAGINVFANLIFATTRPRKATEWFADLEEPSAVFVLKKRFDQDAERPTPARPRAFIRAWVRLVRKGSAELT